MKKNKKKKELRVLIENHPKRVQMKAPSEI